MVKFKYELIGHFLLAIFIQIIIMKYVQDGNRNVSDQNIELMTKPNLTVPEKPVCPICVCYKNN